MGRALPNKTVLSARRVSALKPALEALMSARTDASRLSQDPLQIPHRYADPHDREIAAIFAAILAYGRVSAFMPVIERIMDQANAAGGPRAWVEGFTAADADRLAPIIYRWNRGPDFALLARTLQQTLRRRATVGGVFVSRVRASHRTIAEALTGGIEELRADAAEASGTPFDTLSRGFRVMLSSPAAGSACKRWNMLLRWMARTDWPDLGLWSIDPAKLIIPLDTHTLSVAQMLGLTRRKDGSWRTAAEVTRNLARLDRSDPVRYDFALAHLGISGECRKKAVPSICGRCPMVHVCQIGGGH